MSVFRVKLSTTSQGSLDIDPTTGLPMTTSKQRSVFVMGPGKISRLLVDGATFTDSNYWKRFVETPTGTATAATAFLEVVSDDGSVYSDVASENTFPRVYDNTLSGGDTYADAEIDILGTLGGYAVFTQITNTSGSQDIKVKLNGDSNAIFDLAHGETQVFNFGELSVSSIAFDNSTSGASTATVQTIVSVKSISNS